MSADYSDEPACLIPGTGWIDFSTIEKKRIKRRKVKIRRKRNEEKLHSRT